MKFLLKKISNAALIIFFLFGLNQKISAQAIGDYGSMISGSWNAAATWGTWNGAAWVAAGSTPNASDNVFIVSGTTVTVATSGSPCNSLTVQAGAKLWTNSAVNVYVNVYGPAIVCDGIIGNGAIFDGMSFNIEGATCNITGAGAFDASRMRKSFATAPTTNLTIACNINLRWNAASTTQLYNAAANTLFNVTLNAGFTVNLIASGPSTGNVCIDGLDGTGLALEAGGTFTINGTLIISGKLYLTTNNTNLAYSCSWIINGLVQTSEIVASASGVGLHSLLLNAGAKIDITGTPAWSSLSTTNNTFTFMNTSTIEYSAAGAQLVRVKAEFAAIGTPNQEYGYLILSGSGLKSTTTFGSLYIRNDLTITGTAVLDPNPTAMQIFVGGNWINYNAIGFAEKTTTVFMNGSGLQTITCPGGEVYNILRYSKTGSYLQFNNPVDVITQLVYANNGYIDLNSNALTIRNPLTTGIQGQSNIRYILSEKTDNSSQVIWRIGTNVGGYTIPFGVVPGGAANYIPVIITKGTAANIGDVSLATYGTPANNLPWPTTPTFVSNLQAYFSQHNVPDNRHWTVDRFWEVRSTSPQTLTSLQFSYRATELPDSDATATNLGAQYWNSIYWFLTQYGTGVANNVSVPNFGSVAGSWNTSWTLTSLTSPLPIKLLSFDGIPQEDRVKLNWETASETNNDYFTVEKSLDGIEFSPIGQVVGAHNSTIRQQYNLDDMNPVFGISYYRLKQTDFDGAFTESEIIAVNYKKHKSSFSVFPNPANENAYLISGENEPAEIIIRNIEGKEMSRHYSEASKQIQQLDISGLAGGIYIVEVRTNYETQNLRLIKK